MPSNKVVSSSALKKLMLDDLIRSGLDKNDATKMKVKVLTPSQTKTLVGISASSYKIPYFDLYGKEINFYRTRLLEDPCKFGKSKKPMRYAQEADSLPRLYFAPNIKWPDVIHDTTVPIVITEGEKKAYAACKKGLVTLGLGGVWSFMSKKHAIALLDDFKGIDFKQRQVDIVFDSDLSSNPQVSKAITVLAKRLSEVGAIVYIRFLPDDDNGHKQGLDDYFLHNSLTDYDELPYDAYEISAELWQMNNEVAFIADQCAYFHFPTHTPRRRENIVYDLFANRITFVQKNDKLVEESVAANWCKWPMRRTHPSLEYAPGEGEVLDDGSLNCWRGWGTVPKKNTGFMKVWKKFLDHFFADDPSLREWVEQWMAYPIQYPGTKLYTCVLFFSVMTGTGKTFIGYFLKAIYGDNAEEITQENLHDDHNQWAVEKQFILGDEITSSDKRREKDRLNSMITRDRVTVNIKYVPQYKIRDCINYMFTSQHPDALFIDRHDRRVLVHHAPETKVPDDIRIELDKYYADGKGEGPAALHYYLLNEVDVSKFNPKGEAPIGRAKENMIHLSASDLDNFVNALRSYPETILRMDNIEIKRDLYTSDELIRLYDPAETLKVSKTAFARSMSRHGFVQYVVRTKEGMKRLWAARNFEKWEKASHGERAADYDGNVTEMRNKTKKFEKASAAK